MLSNVSLPSIVIIVNEFLRTQIYTIISAKAKKEADISVSLSVVRATPRLLCDDAGHLENLV